MCGIMSISVQWSPLLVCQPWWAFLASTQHSAFFMMQSQELISSKRVAGLQLPQYPWWTWTCSFSDRCWRVGFHCTVYRLSLTTYHTGFLLESCYLLYVRMSSCFSLFDVCSCWGRGMVRFTPSRPTEVIGDLSPFLIDFLLCAICNFTIPCGLTPWDH